MCTGNKKRENHWDVTKRDQILFKQDTVGKDSKNLRRHIAQSDQQGGEWSHVQQEHFHLGVIVDSPWQTSAQERRYDNTRTQCSIFEPMFYYLPHRVSIGTCISTWSDINTCFARAHNNTFFIFWSRITKRRNTSIVVMLATSYVRQVHDGSAEAQLLKS